ncbi:MBL fold metallo-hydrolase [Acetobacter tropicalis]|uniref:Zn-dependent hydrolase, including glyoxylase n=1 Tax=Acetobacter tropicalis TaxID=104102 RepID=A0A094YKJ7_9PROT|nr:MBL fold metallo-hydrolase [Acetobacter tropicalis]KAA8390712.1 MBL fold metallo-hydrolase [Acetobacter tropicalis]KAA8393223.1 MBL fold metallo-hydrolase [Acetobacter tropicalis]KGB22570.1 Zn-dependent hydrolase, including glyoxylase [Acetobacter tropicalis]MBC9007286.1 MBL fold metallo-hydrolase [Acetobacter tropicalis]MDO8171473.1 MBL fold metallo-hydrolase [Acetobacter tropicalis]
MTDAPLAAATHQILMTERGVSPKPVIRTFFDEATFTASHVVHDPNTKAAAIIDSVLDYEASSGRTSYASAEKIVAYIHAEGLHAEWQLETHAHADHLSAAPWLQEQVGGKLGIGADIVTVQKVFGKIFNAGSQFARDGSQFDRLFHDGELFKIGTLDAIALHVPGHTPADMAFIIGDAAFIGDTLFMPDYGTARADFPGGDARMLFHSIHRLLKLPEQTRLFLCHDYKAPGRDTFAWETTVGAERAHNVHVHDGVTEDDFVQMRTTRDAKLSLPNLIMPSVQVNIRGGHMPEPEDNGVSYIKIPINKM